jgi:phage terminase large subunit GpA-like protein
MRQNDELTFELQPKHLKRNLDFLRKLVLGIPTTLSIIPISRYAEENRILPMNTPFPGPWSNDRTPYSVEIMDNMGPLSTVQRTVVLKGAQIGLTAAGECVTCYYMDQVPAEILFISATEELLRKWVSKRLEPAMESCGITEKIRLNQKKSSRRSGDRTFTKEFIGGTLDLASAQSPASLRADSKRVLVRDEIDGAPAHLRTGEGSYLAVSYARTLAWGDRKKILDFSTPTTYDDSEIYKAWKLGDRREFNVPCPHCGEFQPLKWDLENDTAWGIHADIVEGDVKSVYYVCRGCEEPIYNHHKGFMLSRGYWVPTAKASEPHTQSYHISSLYSPLGMLTWEDVYQKYLSALDDPDGMRSFVNLYLGWPYKDTGTRPPIDHVIENRGGYKSREIPDDVLFLTMGVDVQRGSKRDKGNPARLEYEVCAHGSRFRTWSINYGRIVGEVNDPQAGAWKEFSDLMEKGDFIYQDKLGRSYSPSLIFIDSGYLTSVVYQFTSTWVNTFPSKGFSALRKQKIEGLDEAGPTNFKRYRSIKSGENTILYEVSTNFYKGHVYNNLKIDRVSGEGINKPGFCDFPIDYHLEYFEMLRAEEQLRDGSFVDRGRRNEALDVRVLNLCACDVYLDLQILRMRESWKVAGVPKSELMQVNHQYILKYLEQQKEQPLQDKANKIPKSDPR